MPALGSSITAAGPAVTFQLCSPQATRIELWLYAAPFQLDANLKISMARNAGQIWESSVPLAALSLAGVAGTIFYGYRAWGPNWLVDAAWKPGSQAGFLSDVDVAGNRFNPNKLLLDPYTLEVSHSPFTTGHPDPTAYQSGPGFRATDTGPFAPKGIVMTDPAGDFGAKPATPFKDDIIYEVHLRGLTKNDPDIPAGLRGTYAGAARKVPYLKDLGVTAVEFLPIHETQNALNDDPHLAALHNYWGYDSISYFAPCRRYASDQSAGGPTREWIAMVKAFHDAGIKVYVDVVYNHHGEGDVDDSAGSTGKIFALRGLDNPNYLEARGPSQTNLYQNDNGVGPNVNAATAPVRDLVMESLKYWAGTLGVDGFRFDLAAILGNRNAQGGYSFNRDDRDNILNRAVAELPARPATGGPGVDLIAEPYTANAQGQEQGNFPIGWSEWNDRYRDVFRASQNKLGFIPVTPGAMATRFAGSDDLFRPRGRKPWNSVNYVVSHDGFTLRDLYAYNDPKNNQPFPFGPSPGGRSGAEEMSWDHNGDIVECRQAVRTALAILALSAGTPMVTGGSEFFRTQSGNNNAFNLDTNANWLDWSEAAHNAALTGFTRALFHFRLAHPCLRPAAFFSGTDSNGNGLKDISWLRETGAEVTQDYFANPDNHFLAYRLDGFVPGETAVSIYVAYNGWFNPISVTVPASVHGSQWFFVADTSSLAEPWGNIHASGNEPPLNGSGFVIRGRSVILLIERPVP